MHHLSRTSQALVIGLATPLLALPAQAARKVDELVLPSTNEIHAADIDGDRAVLGTFLRPGTAYVYQRAVNGWASPVELAPDVPVENDSYGQSVAIDGDTAVVTAWTDSTVSPDGGAVYVFVYEGGQWQQQTKLYASIPNPGIGLGFGYSADLDGDLLAVSAFNGDLHVFERVGDEWLLETILNLPGGSSVVDNEQIDVDGDRIAVGETDLVVYERLADGNWPATPDTLVATDVDSSMGLGAKIDLDGDYLFASFSRNDRAVMFRYEEGQWLDRWYMQGTGQSLDVALDGTTALLVNDGAHDLIYRYERQGSEWLRKDIFQNDPAVTNVDTLAMSGGVAIADGNRPGTRRADVFDLDARAYLECTAGVSDGTDFAVVDADGHVVVKTSDGAVLNEFAVTGGGRPSAVTLLADSNQNGAAEVAVLFGESRTVAVHDLLTGGLLIEMDFADWREPVELEAIDDQTGDGVEELALLSDDGVAVDVRDGVNGQTVADVRFRNNFVPVDLVSLAGGSELAVLEENPNRDRADRISVRSLQTGAELRTIWLGGSGAVVSAEVVADINGNGQPEIAVLRTDGADQTQVLIADSASGAVIKRVGFASKWTADALRVLPDTNGNGADELLVYGIRDDASNQRALVKDSLTGARVGAMWFGTEYLGEDIAVCSDVNGNGSADVALLGHAADDRLRVVVKDGLNTGPIGAVDF